jgi:hypothetical protein
VSVYISIKRLNEDYLNWYKQKIPLVINTRDTEYICYILLLLKYIIAHVLTYLN